MKKEKLGVLFNFVLALLLFGLWGSILFIHGRAGAIAWSIAILYLAPIGVVFIIINLIILIINLHKKKRVIRNSVALLLSIIMAFPILALFDVIKLKYPANIKNVKPSITVEWPFNETTIVGWGGDDLVNNFPHARWPSERWAYDLVMEPYNMNSKNLNDYGIYNKEIVSPVEGTIIAAYDKENDILPNTEDFLSTEGNYVYILIDGTRTYLLLNHLKKDSLLVSVGDHINVGDAIGRVGNSGSTSEPHLHIHHQRQDPTKIISPLFAEGLPLYFKNIDGDSMPKKNSIITPR